MTNGEIAFTTAVVGLLLVTSDTAHKAKKIIKQEGQSR